MPFRIRRSKRLRTMFNIRTRVPKGGRVNVFADRVATRNSIARIARQANRSETKYWDRYFTAQTMVAPNAYSGGSDLAAGWVVLNTVPVDTSNGGRIGRKIWNSSIAVRASFYVPTAAATQLQDMRACLVLDKSPQGAFPEFSDVFNGNTIGAYIEALNRDRFSILKQEMFQCNDDNGNMSHLIDWYVPLNFESSYLTEDGTYSILAANTYSIYFLCFTHRSFGDATTASVAWCESRLIYRDA